MDEKKITITQILDDIEAEICDEYCKYPYQFSDDEQAELDAICETCPLKRI